MVKTGKEKGKKGGGLRKKKSDGPDIPWKEALLAYDIGLKEKALADSQFELKRLEDQNARYKARNKQLAKDQEAAVSHLLQSSKEFEKMMSAKDIVSKEQVTAEMMHNWELNRSHDQQLAELEERLVEADEDINREDSQLTYWKHFSEKGQHENKKTVHLLEQELVDMEASFTEISNHLQLTLSRAKLEIEQSTAEVLKQQKYIATEKAIARMDKYGRREVVDNDWLTKETEIHRKEVTELFHAVEKLEDENLKILSELFECQVEDLHISRNLFMTQFRDSENLSENSLLEIDMDEITQSHLTGAHQSCEDAASRDPQQSRPKNAVYQAVEDKCFLLDQLHAARDEKETDEQPNMDLEEHEVAAGEERQDDDGDEVAEGGEEEEEEEEEENEETGEMDEERSIAYETSSHYDGSLGDHDIDPFLEFHHFDDDDFEIYILLQLFLTLPLTSATAERSFATMRRLKSYLRNTMGESRLNGLAQMSINRDLPIDPTQVLDELTKKNAVLTLYCRLQDFLNLGPLQLKLLNVAGKQMPIYKPEMPPDDIMKMKEVRPDDWPVTVAMLHHALRQQRSPRSDSNDAVQSQSQPSQQ